MLRKLSIVGLGVPPIAIIAALVYLLFFGESEPTFQDATQQLASDHTVYGLDLEDRPAALVAPFGADPGESLPLVIALHGYGSNVWEHAQYMGLIERINVDRFLLLMPNGTRNDAGNRFWNATELCCDIDESNVGDAAYIQSLLAETQQIVTVGAVYAVGHSNGGFMAYRLACDNLAELAGVVVLAGSTFADQSRCDNAMPVSILHIHGDVDDLVLYEGDEYPGASETIMRWAQRFGCDVDAAERLSNLDLVPDLPAEETAALRYRQGCAGDVVIEHWRIMGGQHEPEFDSAAIGAQVVGWMLMQESQ